VEVTGECHQAIAGQPLFAHVRIRLEPHGGGERIRLTREAGEQIPETFLAAAMETLTQRAEGGGNLGWPLTQVMVTILGGEAREGESTELAFRRAAADAFDKALREAGIVLLEPIMKLEIITPEENMGDFVSDLQQRRGTITRTHQRGRNTVLDARVPLATLFGYSGDMRSLSQGRATCSMEPAGYEAAPQEVLQAFL